MMAGSAEVLARTVVVETGSRGVSGTGVTVGLTITTEGVVVGDGMLGSRGVSGTGVMVGLTITTEGIVVGDGTLGATVGIGCVVTAGGAVAGRVVRSGTGVGVPKKK
jgi:hypothetical protein